MQRVARATLQIVAFGRGWLHEQQKITLGDNRGYGVDTWHSIGPNRRQVSRAAFQALFAKGGEFRFSQGKILPGMFHYASQSSWRSTAYGDHLDWLDIIIHQFAADIHLRLVLRNRIV